MQEFTQFQTSLLGLASDGEIEEAIQENLSKMATVSNVLRLVGFPEEDKRRFLVTFERPIDAIRISNRYRLKSFGFNGVLIELQKAAS